jgi:hypothetical protein
MRELPEGVLVKVLQGQLLSAEGTLGVLGHDMRVKIVVEGKTTATLLGQTRQRHRACINRRLSLVSKALALLLILFKDFIFTLLKHQLFLLSIINSWRGCGTKGLIRLYHSRGSIHILRILVKQTKNLSD